MHADNRVATSQVPPLVGHNVVTSDNRHEPELARHDRYGNRVDEVCVHPSWHWLLEAGVGRRPSRVTAARCR